MASELVRPPPAEKTDGHGILRAGYRIAKEGRGRLGWGVADQAVSSITNFSASVFIARELGAAVYGAFTLAYVTYAFVLNASRGLATDPLLVRFSATETATWKRAAASCTGTAAAAGVVLGAATCAAAALLAGAPRDAFFALGLTLPLMLLQDSWRFAFFAAGRGSQAFLNDLVCAVGLIPALGLIWALGERSVFWYVLAWGASAGLGAAVGPLQAKVVPRVSDAWRWVVRHRDLGPRYLVEGTANSVWSQLESYGVSALLGLAALGDIQAANTMMGPFMVVFFGMGLVLLPEAVRLQRRSTTQMAAFCVVAAAGLAAVAVGWAVVLWIALPKGLGYFALHTLWRPAYRLLLPLTVQMVGGCCMAGAGIGLHALGVARRSMRAMVLYAAIILSTALVGATVTGVEGCMWGAAAGAWIGALLFWRELRAELRDRGRDHVEPCGAGAALAGAARADNGPCPDQTLPVHAAVSKTCGPASHR